MSYKPSTVYSEWLQGTIRVQNTAEMGTEGSQVTAPGPVMMVMPSGTDWECTSSNERKIHRKKKFKKLNKGLLSFYFTFVSASNYMPFIFLPWS